jgi:hypothetical protein
MRSGRSAGGQGRARLQRRYLRQGAARPKAVGGHVVLGRATSLRADDRPGRAQAAKRLLTVPEEAKVLQDAVTEVLRSATMRVASRDLAHAESDNRYADMRLPTEFRGRSYSLYALGVPFGICQGSRDSTRTDG